MFVGKFKVSQCCFILFLVPVEVGAEDQELSVVGMNLQPFFDFQTAFFYFAVDQVILCLLVELLYLGSDHLEKELYLRVPFLQTISSPKLFVGLRIFQHTPIQHAPQNYQVNVSLIDHYTVLELTQS